MSMGVPCLHLLDVYQVIVSLIDILDDSHRTHDLRVDRMLAAGGWRLEATLGLICRGGSFGIMSVGVDPGRGRAGGHWALCPTIVWAWLATLARLPLAEACAAVEGRHSLRVPRPR